MRNEKATARAEPTTIWNRNFICIMVASTFLTFGHFSVNPLVASYTKYLGTSDQMTGFLAGMFFGVAFAFRPISGPMITKLDKRMLLIFTYLCGSIANLGYALFESVAGFAVFRFLNGLEYSFLGTLVMTLASDNLPLNKMGSGMGIYTIGSAIGSAISLTVGEALLALGTRLKGEGFGFTIVFLFAAAVLALAIIPALVLLPDKKTKEELASTGAWYKNIITVKTIPVAGVILMLMMAYSLYNTYIIEYGKELGIAGAGVFYTVLAITLAVTRPTSGMLTDKHGIQKVVVPGLTLFALSFLIIGSSTKLWMILAGAAVAAVGYGSSQPPLIAMSMQMADPLKRGVASNTIYLGLDLGLFAGPLLGGFVIERSSYATMYKSAIVPVAIALAGFITIFTIFKRRKMLDFNGSS